MDRILQHTAATLELTITVDGVATDPSPDSATVTVTRADGTVIATDAAATNTGVGTFTYTLTPANTATLGDLTAVWTFTLASVEQQLTTRAEVVGGYYFTVAEFNARYSATQLGRTPTTAEIEDARALAEEVIEDACGVAFVPRVRTETITQGASGDIRLRSWPVRSLSAITVNGTAETIGDYGVIDRELVSPAVTFTAADNGLATVVVTYEHGLDEVPARLKQAAMILAKSWLIDRPVTDRALGEVSELGVIRLATPGVNGAVTGIPEVDAAISQYRYPVVA